MTAIQTRKYIIDTIKSVMKSAKITDGLSLDHDEIEKIKDPLYWNNRIDSNSPGIKKDTFVIWTIIGIRPNAHADDKVAVRNSYVAIDIYTKRKSTDQATQTLLERLEKAFTDKGWAFELEGRDDKDQVTGHIQIQYAATIKK